MKQYIKHRYNGRVKCNVRQFGAGQGSRPQHFVGGAVGRVRTAASVVESSRREQGTGDDDSLRYSPSTGSLANVAAGAGGGEDANNGAPCSYVMQKSCLFPS